MVENTLVYTKAIRYKLTECLASSVLEDRCAIASECVVGSSDARAAVLAGHGCTRVCKGVHTHTHAKLVERLNPKGG